MKSRDQALEDLLRSDEVMIGPKEVGAVLGVHQSQISWMASQGQLPFPAIMSGNRTKISRVGFLKWGGWYEDVQSS